MPYAMTSHQDSIRHSMTPHALRRTRQRAIPLRVVELLEKFGSSVRCSGADRLILDKAACKRLTRLGGPQALRNVERWLRVYVVLSDDGVVITVAHRTKRIRRDTNTSARRRPRHMPEGARR